MRLSYGFMKSMVMCGWLVSLILIAGLNDARGQGTKNPFEKISSERVKTLVFDIRDMSPEANRIYKIDDTEAVRKLFTSIRKTPLSEGKYHLLFGYKLFFLDKNGGVVAAFSCVTSTQGMALKPCKAVRKGSTYSLGDGLTPGRGIINDDFKKFFDKYDAIK